MLVLQAQLSSPVMQEGSDDYKTAGVATMTVVHDQTCMDVFLIEVQKQGPAISGAAVTPALLTVLGAFKTYVTSFFSKASALAESGATDAEAVASEAASTAAEEAAVDGEVVAEEVAVSIEFGPLAIVGLAVAAVTLIWMIISFGLSKTMTAWNHLYNATHYEIRADLPYTCNLSPLQEPATGAIPPVGTPSAPPGITPSREPVNLRADWMLQNSETLGSLGLTLRMVDYTGSISPSAMMMIDIPSVGPNSMNAIANGMVDPRQYYAENEGANTLTSLVRVLGGDVNDPVTLRVGTNQTTGQSASPLGGDPGYNYECIILLAQPSVAPVFAVPAFPGPTTATFEAEQVGRFTVRAQAMPGAPPVASLSAAGLPSWMVFVDNRDGTGTLIGSPPQNRSQQITVPVTARNDYASTTQNVTITIQPFPAFTSLDEYVAGPRQGTGFPDHHNRFPQRAHDHPRGEAAAGIHVRRPPGRHSCHFRHGQRRISDVTVTATAGTVTRARSVATGLSCRAADHRAIQRHDHHGQDRTASIDPGAGRRLPDPAVFGSRDSRRACGWTITPTARRRSWARPRPPARSRSTSRRRTTPEPPSCCCRSRYCQAARSPARIMSPSTEASRVPSR